VIAPKLLIRKRMQQIQGRSRPCCFVQAIVEPAARETLEKHFSSETLFRRASYSQSWPQGSVPVPPSLAPAVSAFLKNDACPEISVKTLLAGQMHQGASVWEMMSFELIAKVAFDNLLHLVATVSELDRDIYYSGSSSAGAVAAFETDMSAEIVALEAAAVAA
jgi:hypothetical protein